MQICTFTHVRTVVYIFYITKMESLFCIYFAESYGSYTVNELPLNTLKTYLIKFVKDNVSFLIIA